MLSSSARRKTQQQQISEASSSMITKTTKTKQEDDLFYYWSRPLGAPAGTIRFSLERRLCGRSRHGTKAAAAHWALPVSWNEFHDHIIETTCDRISVLEFSCDIDDGGRPSGEWSRACAHLARHHPHIHTVEFHACGKPRNRPAAITPASAGGMQAAHPIELLKHLQPSLRTLKLVYTQEYVDVFQYLATASTLSSESASSLSSSSPPLQLETLELRTGAPLTPNDARALALFLFLAKHLRSFTLKYTEFVDDNDEDDIKNGDRDTAALQDHTSQSTSPTWKIIYEALENSTSIESVEWNELEIYVFLLLAAVSKMNHLASGGGGGKSGSSTICKTTRTKYTPPMLRNRLTASSTSSSTSSSSSSTTSSSCLVQKARAAARSLSLHYELSVEDTKKIQVAVQEYLDGTLQLNRLRRVMMEQMASSSSSSRKQKLRQAATAQTIDSAIVVLKDWWRSTHRPAVLAINTDNTNTSNRSNNNKRTFNDGIINSNNKKHNHYEQTQLRVLLRQQLQLHRRRRDEQLLEDV